MRKSYIIAARRTAVVPRDGAFADLEIHDLAQPVITACLADCGIATDQVDELIVSNALGAGGNPARHAALAAGLPQRVAGLSLDRQCVGGLDAILLADAMVRSGQADVVIAGGAESYSRRPLRHRTFADGRPPEPYDQARFTPWADQDPTMHDAADALARMLGISKAEQDAWAIKSHAKSQKMAQEIVPVAGVDHDPFARNLTQAICDRAPVLAGSITGANTSVAADGAAFCIVVSERTARSMGGHMLCIAGGATVGGQPDMPGLAPVAAIEQTLRTHGIAPSELGAIEIMEAYAVQAQACVEGACLEMDRVNLSGGSLARGHPIGASGAILAVRLFYELQNTSGHGLAAIAAAGGIGTALLVRSETL